jgi:hypothetical protein
MFEQASRIIGRLPTACTIPVIERFGKEKTATPPIGVVSSLAYPTAPFAAALVGKLNNVVLNTPPSMK